MHSAKARGFPLRLLGPTFCLAVVLGCASTEFKTVWSDPGYAFGGIRTVLVIGVVKEESGRRFFEDQFVGVLKTYGIQATPAYTLVQNNTKLDEATVKSFVQKNNIQAVLVARIIDKRTLESVVPPTTTTSVVSQPTLPPSGYYRGNAYSPGLGYGPGYYPYYQSSQQIVTTTTPGYTVQQQVVDAEVHLYQTAGEKLIWAGTTETVLGANTESLIREYVQMVCRHIFKNPGTRG